MHKPVLGIDAEFSLYLVPLVASPNAKIDFAQFVNHLGLPAKCIE